MLQMLCEYPMIIEKKMATPKNYNSSVLGSKMLKAKSYNKNYRIRNYSKFGSTGFTHTPQHENEKYHTFTGTNFNKMNRDRSNDHSQERDFKNNTFSGGFRNKQTFGHSEYNQSYPIFMSESHLNYRRNMYKYTIQEVAK